MGLTLTGIEGCYSARMPDLADGDSAEVQGSSAAYVLKNTGGVYSCSCPAWRNQHAPIEKRTCKHLRAYRGDAAETLRIGTAVAPAPPPSGGAASELKVLLAHKWEGDV